jgi:AraC-like DNA-binding protein
LPDTIEKNEILPSITVDRPAVKAEVAFRKISDGFWYMRSECFFRKDMKLEISRSCSSPFYELEYFFVDKRRVVQRDMEGEFSLHKQVVFGASSFSKLWLIEAGSQMVVEKFIFTKEFLADNLYGKGRALQDSILKKVIDLEQSHFHRTVLQPELNLIGELERAFHKNQFPFLHFLSIRALALQVFAKFFETSMPDRVCEEEEENILSEGIKIMKANLKRGFPGLSVLADSCHMSVPTFKRKFKAIYLTTPENYFRRLQMEKAEELMRKPGMTVREVGANFGYVNQKSFSLAFKKINGYFPSLLKKNF